MAPMALDSPIDMPEQRLSKRQKLAAEPFQKPSHTHTSRVFAPYRTVGLVSPTNVPFVSVPLGKTTFQITTSVGRSLQTYDLRRGLNLVFLTRPQTPEVITASAAWKDKIVAAWGGDAEAKRGVWIFKRGKKEAELPLPASWTENVQAFCIFGSWIVGVCDTAMLVWKNTTYELYTTLYGVSPSHLTSCIASLPTFLNKIIVGRRDGSAEIWNVSSGKLVYVTVPPSTSYGSVTALEPTPALALVAIAYEKGSILIHDICTDQTLIHLNTPASSPVSSISFRTDGLGAGTDGKLAGVMATASHTTGDVTLWDLNEGGRKAGVLRAAHAHPSETAPGGVNRIEFLAGQAVLVSSGLDNSLKTWSFDEVPFSPIPRNLHARGGHGAPITRLMFLPSASDGSDDTGKWLMASSQDRSLWGWSLRRDGQSTELSQGSVIKKAKKWGLLSENSRDRLEDLKCHPITAIACSLNRDGGIGAVPGKQPVWQQSSNRSSQKTSAEVSAMTGWESVLTAHEGDNKARTWFWGRKRAGRWIFPTGDQGVVTSVAMSPCGTFGLIGSANGGIDMFNLQSGMHRQRFPARLTPMQAKHLRLDVMKHGLVEEGTGQKKFYRGQGKHTTPVVGLAVDSLNKTVVSAGADGTIKFWDFASGLLQSQENWSSTAGITAMRHHRASDLAAFSCTDGCIRVVDITTSKTVRELWPSRPPVADLIGLRFQDFTFSQDGRWIAACGSQLVFLWDLPTGHLIDAFKLRAPCTSLAFSPTGEYLATATTDSVGVDIWTNRSLFTQISTRHLTKDDVAAILHSTATTAPTVSGENAAALIPTSPSQHPISPTIEPLAQDDETVQLSSSLLSLSLVPRSRWQNLMYMDLVRARNKPIEPPKKPEKAPFFLPSIPSSTNPLPTLPSSTSDDPSTTLSRITRLPSTTSTSAFTTLLHTASTSPDPSTSYPPLLTHLRTLPPAAADIDIRSLHPCEPPSTPLAEYTTFVRALTWQLRQRVDFELVQAWMSVFLKVHGDVVTAEEEEEGDGELRDALSEWREVLREEAERVKRLLGYCTGLVGYLRAARV